MFVSVNSSVVAGRRHERRRLFGAKDVGDSDRQNPEPPGDTPATAEDENSQEAMSAPDTASIALPPAGVTGRRCDPLLTDDGMSEYSVGSAESSDSMDNDLSGIYIFTTYNAFHSLFYERS